jgi:preprotein translocase subunit SecF
VEFFRSTNIDFLGKKWWFLGFSLIFSIAGLISMGVRYQRTGNPLPLGIDFRGGTDVYVKFVDTPDVKQIRASLDKANLRNARIQLAAGVTSNEVVIGLDERDTGGSADQSEGKNRIIAALETNPVPGKENINNSDRVGVTAVRDKLIARDPLHAAPEEYEKYARAIMSFMNIQRGGVLRSLDDLKGVVPEPVINALQQDFYTGNFGIREADIVGPQVGEQLKTQAKLAVGFSLVGMLVYLWFRFELIYGVAAVVAVFHDTLITLGAFSLTNKEITLTVIAAILTLVGYSMNDTIVVFDRIRENIKMMRREGLAEIVNRSINQTLSRTILTSGLTFLTVLSLYLFGGEVLNGFSFALVIGILIGTYSSIAVAAPMLVAYQEWRARRRGQFAVPAATGKGKVRAKA